MAKQFIQDRVKFHKKETQKLFILRSKRLLNFTWVEFAKKLKISERTLTDWSRGKFNMSNQAMLKIVKLTKLPVPKGYSIVKWNNHLQNISKNGGRVRFLKYGRVASEEERRKEKWRLWWENTGKYKKPALGFKTLTKIKIPSKSKLLAEFVGIMLGDGGVNKYHINITLSSEEKEYILYVNKIIKKLFFVNPKIYNLKEAKAIKITVNSKNLVIFCQDIGLVLGNKVRQQVDVPFWIKENILFTKECIRGLVDTDGCFYNNSYYINDKKYSYFKIAFTNTSLPLILFVHENLKRMGINSNINRSGKNVRITSREGVSKYIKEIGTHNDKHMKKIQKWKKSNFMLK